MSRARGWFGEVNGQVPILAPEYLTFKHVDPGQFIKVVDRGRRGIQSLSPRPPRLRSEPIVANRADDQGLVSSAAGPRQGSTGRWR